MKSCLLLLPLALAACMTVPAAPTHAATPASASAAASSGALTQYHWQLHDAVGADNQRLDGLLDAPGLAPLQLDFDAKQIHVRHACNQINTSYHLANGHLLVAHMLQTMMACGDHALMQRESAIKTMLRSEPVLTVSAAGPAPQLTLAVPNGQTLTFTGAPKN